MIPTPTVPVLLTAKQVALEKTQEELLDDVHQRIRKAKVDGGLVVAKGKRLRPLLVLIIIQTREAFIEVCEDVESLLIYFHLPRADPGVLQY